MHENVERIPHTKRAIKATQDFAPVHTNPPNVKPIGADRPLTPSGAGAYLGLDEKTITRWARLGYLPAHPLGEGKRKFWRFLPSELEAWFASKNNQQEAA